ncbi:MAG TPA: YoaK family protein [Candidatus Angelobacter sp.]
MDYHLIPQRRTILLFTWAAGCVDAIVYMAGHVFTANMTGNAVLLGISLGTDLSMAAVRSLVALITFILGVLAGAVLVGEKGHGIPWKGVRIAVMVEMAVMAMFASIFFLPFPLTMEWMVQALIVLSAFAMGLQSATVKRLNLPGIATTYITGTMTSLISGLVHHWGSEDHAEDEQDSGGLDPSVALQAWVFILYALAAIVSAVVYKRWPVAVALLPLAASVGVTISVYRQHPPRSK